MCVAVGIASHERRRMHVLWVESRAGWDCGVISVKNGCSIESLKEGGTAFCRLARHTNPSKCIATWRCSRGIRAYLCTLCMNGAGSVKI
jgi:hypothetical protein